jgi:hypothetical protein
MAKRQSRTTRPRRHVDRHGTTAPEVPASAPCDTGRHARCRGEVLSLLVPVGTACQCVCHTATLPAVWADQVAAYPPCGGEAA